MTFANSIIGVTAGLPASFDADGFSVLEYTIIHGVDSVEGDFGRAHTHKDHLDPGSATIEMLLDDGDAGQALLEAALLDDGNYSFIVITPDAVDYFAGQVSSFPNRVGIDDNLVSAAVGVDIMATAFLPVAEVLPYWQTVVASATTTIPPMLVLSQTSISEDSPERKIIAFIKGVTQGAYLSLTDDAGGAISLHQTGYGYYLAVGPAGLSHASAPSLDVGLHYTHGSLSMDASFTITVTEMVLDDDPTIAASIKSASDAVNGAITGSTVTDKWINRRMATNLFANMVWSDLDLMYNFSAGPTAAGARVNWKNPGTHNLTENGNATGKFTVRESYRGGGADVPKDFYLSSTFTLGTSGAKVSQSSAMIATNTLDAATPNPQADAGTNTQFRSTTFGGSGHGQSRMFVASTVPLPTGIARGYGLGGGLRTDVNTAGGFFGPGPAQTQASPALTPSTTTTFRVLGNISGDYSQSKLSHVFLGKGLTDTQLVSFNSAVVEDTKNRGIWHTDDMNLPSAPPLLSTDPTVLYNNREMVFQQIPCIAAFKGGRIIRVHYGVNSEVVTANSTETAPVTSGEGPGARVRISASDDHGASWTHGAVILPSNIAKESVGDPYISRLPDGRALITFPYNGEKGLKTVYGIILKNPGASLTSIAAGGWEFGRLCAVGFGWLGHHSYRNDGSIRTYTQRDVGDEAKDLCYSAVTILDDVVRFDIISQVPDTPHPIAFYEASFVELSGGRTLATWRTQEPTVAQKLYYSINPNDGLGTWSTPLPLPFPTIEARSHMVRSPSGRLMFFYNDSDSTSRKNMSVRIFASDDINGPSVLYCFDDRATPPPVSYPAATFEMDANGVYTGYILVSYDRGRGLAESGSVNELIVARMNEEKIVAGMGSVDLTVVNI